jgi:hypothetical protein
MTSKNNERISLWILEKEREQNHQRAAKELAQSQIAADGRYVCSSCKRGFNEAKLIEVCPHCQTKLSEDKEKKKAGCRFWLGYLSQRDKTEKMLEECVECRNVMDCLLNRENSETALTEIKKWY